MILVNQLGSDAIRLYLMNSPLVRGKELKFNDKGVNDIRKDVFLPWYYMCKFLLQEINRYEETNLTNFVYKEELFMAKSTFKFTNPLDKWILAKTQEILGFIREEFENYRLYTVLEKKLAYLD